MEFVILIVAGLVVYYLYVSLQEYLKNPLHKRRDDEVADILEDDPYMQLEATPSKNLEGFGASELGVMLALLKNFPHQEKLQETMGLIVETFIAQYYKNNPQIPQNGSEAMEFFKTCEEKDTQLLAEELLKQTYAEYKKRLKFVEFLLFLGYLDGELDAQEKEYILDIAALLNLDNEDFNGIYDAFEARFQAMGEASDALQNESEKSKGGDEATQGERGESDEAEGENAENEAGEKLDLPALIAREQVDIFESKNNAKDLSEGALSIAKALKSLS